MAKPQYDVAVIGGGPAGMMAAIRAAQAGAQVILLEKKHAAGLKLLMTGKERCNLTNHEPDPRRFVEFFGVNGKFLLPALYRFGVAQTVAFFNQNGLPTKVERGGRVFPQSDRAKDVQMLLLRLLRKYNVEIRIKTRILDFVVTDKHINKIVLESGEMSAESIVIATGGLSYPETGSTGDGYAWAAKLGHTIVKPRPALSPVLVREKYVEELQGLSLKNVNIAVLQQNKKLDERFGEALFMDNGLSGPIVLDLSKTIGDLLDGGEVRLHIDFKPALDFEKLDNRLIRDFEEHNNKAIKNALPALLPQTMIPVMLRLAEINPDKKCNEISKKERKRLRLLLKEFPFTVKSLVGFKKAVITAGGITLNEVEPKTMRSKILDNLFFAGEILDLDGPTGGYNLQVCWSTGYVAGESAAKTKY